MADLFNIRVGTKYFLGKKLGGGSFGDIFLATDTQTGEYAAVKLVIPGFSFAGAGYSKEPTTGE